MKNGTFLRLFDEILASDGRTNLKGPVKAQALVERFGERQFVYVGSDSSDLPVWRRAASAVLVNASRAVVKAARTLTLVEHQIERRRTRLTGFRALRPHQWSKNLLVFVPILTANAFLERGAVADTLIMFLAFCAASSAIYVLNHLTDLVADRQHPRKRQRPFASGDLAIAAGTIISLLFCCWHGFSAPGSAGTGGDVLLIRVDDGILSESDLRP